MKRLLLVLLVALLPLLVVATDTIDLKYYVDTDYDSIRVTYDTNNVLTAGGQQLWTNLVAGDSLTYSMALYSSKWNQAHFWGYLKGISTKMSLDHVVIPWFQTRSGRDSTNGVITSISGQTTNTWAQIPGIVTTTDSIQALNDIMEPMLTSVASDLSSVKTTVEGHTTTLTDIHDHAATTDVSTANLAGWNPETDSTNVHGLDVTKLGYIDAPISGAGGSLWTQEQIDQITADMTTTKNNVLIMQDTMQNYDNWIAKESSVQLAKQAAYDARDTLQSMSTWLDDTLDAMHRHIEYIIANPGGGGGSSCCDSVLGCDTLGFYLIDTTGTDSLVGPAVINLVNTSTGVRRRFLTPGSSTITLIPGTYRYYASEEDHEFPTGTFEVTGSTDSVAVKGYDLPMPTAPFGSSLCCIYGWVRDRMTDSAAHGVARLTLATTENNRCDSTISIMQKTAWEVALDADGRFEFCVPYSSCYKGAKYYLEIVNEPYGTRAKFLTVPDSTTYRVWW